MSKTRLQAKDIVFCSACSKPLAGDYFTIKNKLHGKEKWSYHNTVAECANAPALKKDWRRIDRRESTDEHLGPRTDIHGSDGRSRDADDDMSVWL